MLNFRIIKKGNNDRDNKKLLEYFKKNNIKGTEIAEILGLKKSPLTDWKMDIVSQQ